MKDRPQFVHQDDALLVVEKPAGMPSISLKETDEATVAAWILKQHPAQAELPQGSHEAGLCHRLDNDTSGLLIAARTSEAYEDLRRQFTDGSARKEYAVLVLGNPLESGAIDAPIAHHPRKKQRMVVCESAARAEEWKGRPAHTAFRVVRRFDLLPRDSLPIPYALLDVAIETGVRHQIRVHLAHAGFPIAGDHLYQNAAKRAEDLLRLTRHFLHCARLTIQHPLTHDTQTFESPLPPDLEAALATLRER
jgi:23S rRNA pseudouridine1911/1915/1917 synthase